ncbi:MAG: hypothetical protein R3344_03400, partial [Acidobacteriota bacterium]|nr:hypothetical protein [Acidobacteriota bacterium]
GRFAQVPEQIKMATGLLVRHSASCLETGEQAAPSHPFEAESVPGGRSYTLRKVQQDAISRRQTGYPDVDSILARFQPVGLAATVF